VSDDLIEPSPLRSTVSSFPVRSRLLVVDDEPLILEGMVRLLGARNYDVVTANGGCEAAAKPSPPLAGSSSTRSCSTSACPT